MSRQVKNAKDIVTGELVYFVSHAKATYLGDGSTVEDTVNGIKRDIKNITLSNEATTMVSVTYEELKNLRDNGELVAGMQYRITDYETTTAQPNTRSAGHQFDIIVTADDEKTLNEVARACRSEFDIEKYKNAYSGTWGDKMLYVGTQEYEGKEYHLYESESPNVQMLVDFNNILERFPSTSDVYPFRYYPNYVRELDDSSGWGVWECGKDCNESIDFVYSEPNYFDYCKLDAWQIWYSLDNDAERFAWAKPSLYSPITNQKMIIVNDVGDTYIYVRDSSYDSDGKCAWLWESQFGNISFLDYVLGGSERLDSSDIIYTDSEEIEVGAELDMMGTPVMLVDMSWTEDKGVIYRMIDEWNNDCPYDFKNILFKRGIYADGKGIEKSEGDGDFQVYCYTFSWEDTERVIMDATIVGNNGYLLNDVVGIDGVYGNVIKSFINYTEKEFTEEVEAPRITQQFLNDIVLLSTYSYDSRLFHGCYSNTFGYGCCSNNLGNECYSNTFGYGCCSNNLGNECYSNTFGDDCSKNILGDKCYNNIFSNDCSFNSFGNKCYSNTFGANCYSNTFGSGCPHNTFADNCYYNTFGTNCRSNTFGINCYSNTFGEACIYNIFSNICHHNSFGNQCTHNSFGNGCTQNSFGTWCIYNNFGNYCCHNKFNMSCDNNSFGNECWYNSFGNYCDSNIFGNECESNTFGTNCYNNNFDNRCFSNKFGGSCNQNSLNNICNNINFGDNCSNNSFGNSSHNNIFGDNCSNNSFGNSCIYNSFGHRTDNLKYCEYNHFDDGCSYNIIQNTGSIGSSYKLKNININKGVSGTASSYNYINIDTLNSEKEINVFNYNSHIYIDYGDVFKVTYSELVDLRDNSQLIAGRQYRITDYVTSTSQENTKSAEHQFDIIVTALDDWTLSEEAQAIQNTSDGYFDGSNLSAWKIWYSLDNDTSRFAWADDERIERENVIEIIADSEPCTIKSDLIDGNTFITPFNFESCVWVDAIGTVYMESDNHDNHDIDELVYEWDYFLNEKYGNVELCIYKSDADLYEEEGCADSDDKYVYRGLVTVDGETYDYWQKYEMNENGEYDELVIGGTGYVYATTPRIVSNPEDYSCETTTTTVERVIPLTPKGVIYRMIDEFGNDCPYDFKNIMFKNTEDNEYLYTFSDCEDYVLDATVRNIHNGYCMNNKIRTYLHLQPIAGENSNHGTQHLNNITIRNISHIPIINNYFGYNCYNISIPAISNVKFLNNINDFKLQNFYTDVDYETRIALNSKGEIKMYCEADLIK